MFYCKGRNVLLTEEDLEKIPKKYTKLASVKYKGSQLIYRTLKKKNGFCIFFKNGKCKAPHRPLFCRTHPIYFRINFQLNSIIWCSFSKKRRSFINKAKKMLMTFLEKADTKTIFIYLLKSKRIKLEPIEEEALPKPIVKKLKLVKKFL